MREKNNENSIKVFLEMQQLGKNSALPPSMTREQVKRATLANPAEWIHFGAGNIFRAFQANV